MSIDRLLRDTEALPLEMDILNKMAGKGDKCRALPYSKVEQADKLEDIINETHPYAILLVMDNRTPEAKVGHYVTCFYKNGDPHSNVVIFFDPYGMKINKLMSLTRNRDNLMRLIR